VLNGGVFLAADLARAIDLPCKMDFVGVSSYGDGAVSGALSMTKELSLPVKDMDVLVVEDVLDTGKTLSHLLDYLKAQGASSVKLCVMLDKAESHVVDIAADYVGAVVGSEFLVGYGLDYGQHYRNLPYIGVLKEAIYR
jgi:hypoxanthine phosphoribosyltransferase